MQGRYGEDAVLKIYHGSDAGTADPEYVHENPASLIRWRWYSLVMVISGCFPEIFQREAVKIMRIFRRTGEAHPRMVWQDETAHRTEQGSPDL